MKRLTANAALAGAVQRHSLSLPGSSIEAISTKLVGLHNTNPAGPYLSIRARLSGFERADLDASMWESWRMARFRAMRLTMFVFPSHLLEIAAAATRQIVDRLATRWLSESALSQQDFDRLAALVDAALADGPLTVRGLRQTLDIPQTIDLPGVVARMCDRGQLVGGAPPRKWRSAIRVYHRWNDVLPEVDLNRWDEDAAIAELIAQYVRSYGPVTIDDMSWWTGLTKRHCRAALITLGADVEEVVVDDWPAPLFRVADAEPADEPGSDVTALPLLDPYVQGYRDRIRFLDPALHDHVYDGGGNATATLVQRGRIIGVWQFADEPAESIRYHLFSAGPPSVRRGAEADLAAAGELYFDRSVDVVEMPTMTPLRADGGRSASHPLDSRLHRPSRRKRD